MGVAASTARTDSSDVDALAEIATLLADPASQAWALSAVDGGRDNEAAKRSSGAAADLIRQADPTWAIVARPAPDLLVFDLDECADLALPPLRDAAEDAASTVLAVVESGRPNCAHVWIAPPTRYARARILDTAEWVREHHHLDAAQVDERSGTTIRLPGSASLKSGGGRARLVDVDGAALASDTALADIRRALTATRPAEAEQQRSTGPRAPSRTHRPWPRAPRRTVPRPAAALPLPLHSEEVPSGRLVVEAPRAWRPRRQIDSEGWTALNDADSPDRSAAATAGAWALFRHGIRSFAAARWWYQNFPCFDKFRHRDETKSPNGSTEARWDSCRQHWEAVRDRGVNHRLPLSPDDQSAIDAARAEARSWSDPLLQAAALVIIEHRFATGHGLNSRPIARRDLQGWLHLSDGTANDVIHRLQEIGFLHLTAPHTRTGDGCRSANRYDLERGFTPVDPDHDVTNPDAPALEHPLWGLLGHHARAAWTLLLSPGSHTTRSLAAALAIPVGDHRHGLLLVLRRLRDLGVVTSTGSGRWLRWSATRSTRTLDDAARRSGALDRAHELAARITAERAAWHAETRAEAGRAVRGLAILRERLHHDDAIGSTRKPLLHAPTPRSRHSDMHRVVRRAPLIFALGVEDPP